jgi:GT2 family glycosyltransferase
MILSVCIVNYNGRDFLPACIESLFGSDMQGGFEVVVVDNGSTDGSVELVRERFPDVTIIESGRNDGFAAASNIAFDSARGGYVLFLNPDTIVPPDALRRMVDFMEGDDGTVVCGCRLYNPITGRVESSARSYPELLPLFWNLTYMDRLFPSNAFFSRYLMTSCSEYRVRDTDWVTGACMLVRADAFEQIGRFDTRYFMYCEDIDICYRVKLAGWRIRYYPDVSIGHYRGLSSARHRTEGEGELSMWGAAQFARSILLFYDEHYGTARTILLRAILIITSLFKAACWISVGSMVRGWKRGSSRAKSYCAMIVPAATRIRPHGKGG